MAWMKGRAPHRWQMQRIDVDAPFRVQMEETPGTPPRSAGADEGPGVLASKMRKSRCQIDKSSREWTSGGSMLVPLPSPVPLLGQDSGAPLWRPLIGHTSRRRAGHRKQTPHGGQRESDQDRQPGGGGGGSSGKHQCGGGHAASRRQNSGCLRLEPAAVSGADCLEAPVCIFASRLSPWPTPGAAAAAAGRDGLAPGHAESPWPETNDTQRARAGLG